MHQLIIRKPASLELEEAVIWYERQQHGLGLRFLEEVEKGLNLLRNNPKLFAKKKKEWREYLIKPFPFLIVYRIDQAKDAIIVLSVFHSSKNQKNKYRDMDSSDDINEVNEPRIPIKKNTKTKTTYLLVQA